jgi:hypothetical protein
MAAVPFVTDGAINCGRRWNSPPAALGGGKDREESTVNACYARTLRRGDRLVRFHLVAAAVLGLVLGSSAFPGAAEGVTRIQQADGTTQIYRHVTMRMAGPTLWLRSGDHAGVLEVTSGACTYLAGLQRCLPYKTVYHDRGTAHAIALEHGAIYTNLTGNAVQLPHSGDRLGPHEVRVVLHTMRGTYVTVQGTLDQLK